ncbi:serine-rich adhesin for platelets-like isoform X2 [Littorina saxatilis]|uniref:Uncharacterized protein n=1 Tax=Littorina saxatilis TaxID=31220 RepID=A0AAN9AZ11_9CAEN
MADYKSINGRATNRPPASAKSRDKTAARSGSGNKRTTTNRQGGPEIPIHVDGNRDELTNVDPERTLAELDLQCLGESHERSSTSRPASSNKRVASGRRSADVVAVATRMAETDGTRARPIKPHESEPFLTVGTQKENAERSVSRSLGPDSKHKGGNLSRNETGSHSPGGSRASTLHRQGSAGFRSPNFSPSPSLRYQSDRTPGRSLLNRMYMSPSNTTHHPNPIIKMPFKHNIRKPSEKEIQEPAQGLKEMTALAIYQIQRILSSENGTTKKKKHGHLKKGKLQPLYPVNVTGPSITQCRGILSETRSYSASSSRTLQRRRHIVAQMIAGKVTLHGDLLPYPLSGDESVHRVSAASSVEDLSESVEEETCPKQDEDFQKELASMEEDAIFPQEMAEKRPLSKEQSQASLGESSGLPPKTPISLDQDIADLQNPDFSTLHPPASSQVSREATVETSNIKHEENTKEEVVFPEKFSPSKENGENKEKREMMTNGRIEMKKELNGRKGENIPHKKTAAKESGKSENVKKQDNEKKKEKAELKSSENHTKEIEGRCGGGDGDGDGIAANNGNNSSCSQPTNPVPEVKRPQSANVKYSEPILSKPKPKERPKTAASMKAVRFADQAHSSDGSMLPLSRPDSRMDRGKGRNKNDADRDNKFPEGGCKPADFNQSHRGDDSDDDKGGGGDRGEGRGGGGIMKGQTGPGSNTAGGSSANSVTESQNSSSHQGKSAAGISNDRSDRGSENHGEKIKQGNTVSIFLTENLTMSSSNTEIHDNKTVCCNTCKDSVRKNTTVVRETVEDSSKPCANTEGSSCQRDNVSSVNSQPPHALCSDMSLPSASSTATVTSETTRSFSGLVAKVAPLNPTNLSVKLSVGKGGRIVQVPEGSSLFQLLLDVSSEVGTPTPPSVVSSTFCLKGDQRSVAIETGSMTDQNALSLVCSEANVMSHDQLSKDSHDVSNVSSDCLGSTVSIFEEKAASSSGEDQQCVTANNGTDPSHNAASLAVNQLAETTPYTEKTKAEGQVHSAGTASSHSKPSQPSVTAIMHTAHSVNPRVGVFVCKHASHRKKKENTSHVQPKPQEAEEGAQGDRVFPMAGLHGDEMKSIEREKAAEDCAEADSFRHKSDQECRILRRDRYGNRMTDLVTHLAIGAGEGGEQLNPFSQQTQGLGVLKPGQGRAIFGSHTTKVAGILKKKSSSSPNPWKPAPKTRPQSSTRNKVGIDLDTFAQEQDLKEHVKSARKQQMFTHHSKRPFVFPSDDPFSQEVAMQLKFGDSPYLKEIKLRESDRPRSKPKGRDRTGGIRGGDQHFGRGEISHHALQHPTKEKGSPNSDQYHRPTRVKFGNFSMRSLDLNQNCEDNYTTVFGMDGMNGTNCLSALEYSPNHTSYSEVESDDADDEMLEEADDNYDDFATRFEVLESELSAVRSEIKLEMLDRDAELILEEMERCSSVNDVAAEANSDDNDYDDDDYVYEDDGTSEEEEDETDGNTDDKKTKEEKDEDNAYSTYYRALLREYRQKCMTVGEGNLVISNKLTWPYASSSQTAATATNPHQPKQSLKVRPYSAGSFRTLGERRHSMKKRRNSFSDNPTNPCLSRTASLSDSGLDSEGMSDFEGRVLDHWNSCLSIDGESVVLGSSNRCDSAMGHSRSAWLLEADGSADGLHRKEMPGKKVGGSRPTSGREENPNLTVVASSPPKISARAKVEPQREKEPAAPFPPLCFAVNARPPPGYLFYFAYSTYMNPDRLGSLLQRQIDKRYWAILFGFDLAFNKKGSEEESSGGLANIVFNPFSSVEGCIFLLAPAEIDQLDAFTDAPKHYVRVVLPVWMSEVSGSGNDLDLAKYCVPAVTYVAQDEWTLQGSCTPNDFVATQCLKSADLLTPNYCDRLRSIVLSASVPSPSQQMVS